MNVGSEAPEGGSRQIGAVLGEAETARPVAPDNGTESSRGPRNQQGFYPFMSPKECLCVVPTGDGAYELNPDCPVHLSPVDPGVTQMALDRTATDLVDTYQQLEELYRAAKSVLSKPTRESFRRLAFACESLELDECGCGPGSGCSVCLGGGAE